ncbi:hypothetical protein KKC13_07295 [bacterium]|nr:hypothetical protein [bacterium]
MILILFGTSLNLSAKDGVPFIHPFGELRVYFKDWLVVCADKGEGECRMVNYVNHDSKQKTGFFPDSRLTIVPAQSEKTASLDFYHKNAPSVIDSITIAVDRKKLSLDSEDYQTPEQNRMMETYVVDNETKLNTIIEASKPGRWLTFTYAYPDNQHKKVRFSLRGFTKAFAFIAKQTK